MNVTPPITIAVCTRNRALAVGAALDSLLPQLDAGTELLVVDNASTDNTPEVLAKFAAAHAALRVFREPRPGFSAARNAALIQARGEFVVFLDDDELAEPGWLAAYRRFLAAPPTTRLGCVGGPYLALHVTPPPKWLEPDYGAFDRHSVLGPLIGRGNLAGGNCAYPRRLVLAMGGFAEGLPRREDTELNLRLRAAGYEIWWLPEARVKHVIPPERFRFRAQCRLWFDDGRAVVAVRLLHRSSRWARWRFLVGRLAVTPLQMAAQLVGAAVVVLLGARRCAARLVFRAVLGLGTLWEGWRRFPMNQTSHVQPTVSAER